VSLVGKPNAKGRSSGIVTGREGKARRPPKNEPWVWLTRDLIESPSWCLRSINTVRFIDFLLVDHMNHGGNENGALMATYDQLVIWGLTRSEIRYAIDEAEFLGLLQCGRGGRWAGTNQPSIFRLTFLHDRENYPPTNEWKHKSEEAIREWKNDQADRRKARKEWRKKQKSSSTSRTTVVLLPELRNAEFGKGQKLNPQKTPTFTKGP